MQEKPSDKEDKFAKIIAIYKSKYGMTVEYFLKFLRQKVEASAQAIQTIENIILQHQQRRQNLQKEQLENYLHLIAAAQSKVNIKTKSFVELRQYVKIKFLSSKNNKKEQNVKKQQVVEMQTEEISDTFSRIQTPQPQTNQGQRQNIAQEKSESKAAKREQVFDNRKNQREDAQSQKINDWRQAKQQHKQKLSVIEQNLSEEYSSNFFHPSTQTGIFQPFPESQMMKLRYFSQKPVQITGYDKFGQNYFNPIIKYKIVYQDKVVYRRYTQFQNLMKFLDKQYEGFILPELPPKQGLKSNLSYFRGIDQAFLNDRQQKLESMLNMLLNLNLVSEQQVLRKFLTDQEFEVESPDEAKNFSYLQQISKIAFNAKQLKNYGMAYYNYWKQFKKSSIKTSVTDRYKEVEPLLTYCLSLDRYRNVINANFDQRREIFKQLDNDQEDRILSITEFDKVSQATASEVKNLQKEINKYLELISQQKWLTYLISQKEAEGDTSVGEFKVSHKQILNRVAKMECNLMESIDSLVRSKTLYFEEVKQLIVEWRERIHP